MRDPLLSIIIPAYNVEKYLGRCVDSVLNQTIGMDNMEIILVDDLSTDNTKEIIRHYESEYECVHAIYNKINYKQGGARNRGIETACGKYLAFVDSDDWIEPDMYEKMYEKAEESKCEIVSVWDVRDPHFRFLNEEEKETGRSDRIIRIENDMERRNMIISGEPVIGAWNCIFLKKFITDNNISFPEHLFYEDLFWGTIIKQYFQSIYIIEKKLYHYFVREESTSIKVDFDGQYDFFIMQKLLWDELNKRTRFNILGEALQFDYLMNYFLIGMKLLSLRFTTFPYEQFQKMRDDIYEKMPDWYENRYIKTNTTEFQKLQFEMLKHDLNRKELDQFVAVTRQYYGSPAS